MPRLQATLEPAFIGNFEGLSPGTGHCTSVVVLAMRQNQPMLSIRPATIADLPEVAEIYRHYVINSTATFDLEPLSVDGWERKLQSIVDGGRPFLVLVDEAEGVREILGYAYLGVFRGRAGWAFTAEDSIYLRPDAGGRGLGTRLLSALLDAVDPSVTRNIMAMVSDEVPESVALHQNLGFVEVGRSAGVGRKFDRWVGCVYLQFVVPVTK